MVIDMNESKLDSVEHIREFLAGTSEVAFSIPAEESSRHGFIERVLQRLRYFTLAKSARGVVFAYMRRLSGYSHAQLCRLIAQYQDTESLTPRGRTSRTSFTRIYTREDATLLAEVDRLHDTLSGPATKVLLGRAAERFGDQRFSRLSQISVSHLYNLRKSEPYRKQRLVHRPTRASRVAIGVRRAPAPEGLPGYIRIDTVHQGDQDGVKGVYHINAVDIVTQWELVACVERISEVYLLPVIALLLEGFPFEVRGFRLRLGLRIRQSPTSPAYWKNCASSSPARAPATPTTTPWPNPRTAPSCASSWATPTSPKNTPLASTPSTAKYSTLILKLPPPLLFRLGNHQLQRKNHQDLPPSSHHDSLGEAQIHPRFPLPSQAGDNFQCA